jgi:hypothetical protein
MSKPYSMSEQDARSLAKRIAKTAGHLRIKQGKTNGRICLHVRNPGKDSLTLYSPMDWEIHPANVAARNAKQEAREAAAEAEAKADKDLVVKESHA